MSTLEISCAQCEKKFRVRAEFAGRSTRCPGCSAPIIIAGLAKPIAPPPKPVEEERSRPSRRPRDDEDDEPRRPQLDLKPAETACRREQIALIFAIAGILGGFFVSCLGNMGGRAGSGIQEIMLFFVLLVAVGPSLATGAFGIMARIAAMGVPSASLARGSAIASLLCSIAGLVCLLGFAIALVSSFDSQRADELPMVITMGGLIVSVLGSVVTFTLFVNQIGIVQRSAAVSRAVARTGIAISVCVLSLIGIGLLYTLASEAMGPSYSRGPFGDNYSYQDHSGFYQVMLGILMPLAFGVVLILYHRLLAAGRRAASEEAPASNNDVPFRASWRVLQRVASHQLGNDRQHD